MSEETSNEIGGKLQFMASTTPDDKEVARSIIDDDTKVKKGITSFEQRGGWRKREIPEHEQQQLTTIIAATKKKLLEMGIPNAESLVPTIEHMSLLEAEGTGHVVAVTGQYNKSTTTTRGGGLTSA